MNEQQVGLQEDEQAADDADHGQRGRQRRAGDRRRLRRGVALVVVVGQLGAEGVQTVQQRRLLRARPTAGSLGGVSRDQSGRPRGRSPAVRGVRRVARCARSRSGRGRARSVRSARLGRRPGRRDLAPSRPGRCRRWAGAPARSGRDPARLPRGAVVAGHDLGPGRVHVDRRPRAVSGAPRRSARRPRPPRPGGARSRARSRGGPGRRTGGRSGGSAAMLERVTGCRSVDGRR